MCCSRAEPQRRLAAVNLNRCDDNRVSAKITSADTIMLGPDGVLKDSEPNSPRPTAKQPNKAEKIAM